MAFADHTAAAGLESAWAVAAETDLDGALAVNGAAFVVAQGRCLLALSTSSGALLVWDPLSEKQPRQVPPSYLAGAFNAGGTAGAEGIEEVPLIPGDADFIRAPPNRAR